METTALITTGKMPPPALAMVKAVPKIFEQDGFSFYIYSNEHGPIHVHVRHGGGEAVFNIGRIVELRESKRLKVRQLRRAEKLAEENRSLIVAKWYEHLGDRRG